MQNNYRTGDKRYLLEVLYDMDDQLPFSSQEKPKQTVWPIYLLHYVMDQ